MKNIAQSPRSWQLVLTSALSLALITAGSKSGTLSGQEQSPAIAKSTPAETASKFLRHLENAELASALQLWEIASVNDKLKMRIDKMAAKVRKLGGIKKIDIGQCEPRRVKRFEQKTGEKIDVVPVEIICGDESLILAVFSIRKSNDTYRLFQLESLKEWGGTASLDDELNYSN